MDRAAQPYEFAYAWLNRWRAQYGDHSLANKSQQETLYLTQLIAN